MRRARSLLLSAPLFVLPLVATGCVKKPTMHLDHAEVSGVQISMIPPQLGILMTVVVDVYNPNSYDVAVRAMRGTVFLADRYSLPVTFQAPGDGVWLPSEKTTPMRVPVEVPVQIALAILQESWTTPQIPYRMQGHADVTATRTFKVESDDYSVNEAGFIDRAQIDASVRSVLAPHR